MYGMKNGKHPVRWLRAALAAALAAFLLCGSTVCLADGLGSLLGGQAGAEASEAAPAATTEDRIEGAGYDTPGEAVTAYAEYLKVGDLTGMVSTFAIESYVDAFDTEAYLAYMKNFNTAMISGRTASPVLGTGDSLRRALSIENRRAGIVESIVWQYLAAVDPSGFFTESGLSSLSLPTEEAAADFVGSLANAPDFSGLEIGSVLSEDSDEISAIAAQLPDAVAHAKAMIPLFGAEDIEEVCLSLRLDGEDYILFMRAAQYGGRWYNLQMSNNIATLLAIPYEFGGLVPAAD